MEIITGDFADGYWFEPDFGDNRSLPVDKRARVKILPLTGRDKLKIEHTTGLKTKADRKIGDVVSVLARREWAKQRRILEERIVEVQNFTRKDTKTGESVPIKTGKELIETVLAASSAKMLELLDQIYEVILDASALDETQLGE